MITLHPNIIKELQSNGKLRGMVQVALGISHTTLYKYMSDNDSKLANVNVLEVLKEHTQYKTEKELLSR